MTLIELFILLWSLVGSEYEWHNTLPDGLDSPLVHGAFSCSAGAGWVREDAPLAIVVHELAHAYDCLDDGMLNGSPGHSPVFNWDFACELLRRSCLTWRAEHYAQEVVRTKSLR